MNPARYSQEAFVEDSNVYLDSATALLGLLHSNIYLRENCEVGYYTNKKHPLTLHKHIGLRLARVARTAISASRPCLCTKQYFG